MIEANGKSGVTSELVEDGVKVNASRLMEMIEQQGHRCALSGLPLTPETATLDHKTSLASGGAHEMSNVHIVHHTVNEAKGTMSVSEFVTLCSQVVSIHGGSLG